MEIFGICLPFFNFVPGFSLILDSISNFASFHKDEEYDDRRTTFIPTLNHRHQKAWPFIDSADDYFDLTFYRLSKDLAMIQKS